MGKLVFLSGGTGTPKLLEGFREFFPLKDITVITNPGDDYDWYGLRVCPDLDTVLYLFSGQLDLAKYWGVKDESYTVLEVLKGLGLETWFTIGDKDLGLHVFRTHLLNKGLSLSEVSNIIRQAWGIIPIVIPASNDRITTLIHTDLGVMHFQEFWVKHQGKPAIQKVEIASETQPPRAAPEVIEELKKADLIIIGPSNPVSSIGPILKVDEIYSFLKAVKHKVVVISPFIKGTVFSGPAEKMMSSRGLTSDVYGLFEVYKEISTNFIVDFSEPRETGLDVNIYHTDTKMNTLEDKVRLAREVMDIFSS